MKPSIQQMLIKPVRRSVEEVKADQAVLAQEEINKLRSELAATITRQAEISGTLERLGTEHANTLADKQSIKDRLEEVLALLEDANGKRIDNERLLAIAATKNGFYESENVRLKSELDTAITTINSLRGNLERSHTDMLNAKTVVPVALPSFGLQVTARDQNGAIQSIVMKPIEGRL